MLGADGMAIETLEVAAAIHDADAQAASALGPSQTQESLKQMIRQQVKAEEKTNLTDNVYLAAFRSINVTPTWLPERPSD